MTPIGQVEGASPRHDVGTMGTVHGSEAVAHPGHDRPFSPPDVCQPVLSIRARVDRSELRSFIRQALHEIRIYIEDHRLEVQGPPFTICRPAPHGVDVEVGWPVGQAGSSGRIWAGSLPAGLIRRSYAGGRGEGEIAFA